MTFNLPQGEFPFPDEYAPVKVKVKDEYGLQAAKAMFYSRDRQGYSIFNQGNQNTQALIELAQGRQSTDNIRRMFGFFEPQQAGGLTNKDNGTMAYIDVQVLNLATKYVNRTVAKLQKYKYKIGLSAIDPISVDEAKEYDTRIRTYYMLKDYYQTMGQQAQEFYQDLNVDILPEFPEEMLFNLSANAKIRKIIDGEKTIQLVNSTINDLSQIQRQVDWDFVVHGHGHIHCYNDVNGMPKNDWINPEYWGGSYVDNEDHKKQEYSFFVDFITVNQFRKESDGKLTEDQIEEVLRAHAFPSNAASWNGSPDQMINYDGLRYIPVIRFYFLSNDHSAVAMWKNEHGNHMQEERTYQYKPSGNKTREEKIYKQVYTSVYGGNWVADTNIVYDYGKKDIPRSNLVNTRLPIVSFAPNMKKGRYVSLLAQMIEPLVMINVAWNKVKDVLAKGRLGIMDLNLTAFENLALGKGGANWSAKEALDFMFQTNIAVNRQQANPSGGSVGKNINFTATGVTVADYFNTMTTCIQFLDDLSGATLAETTDLPDRLTSKTMLANVAAGSDAIEYLVNAHVQTYYQVSHMNLLLTQAAKRNKAVIKGMIPALGKYTTEYFEVPDDLPYCDYGLTMEREASEEEWAQFYMEVSAAVQQGQLNASDSAFLREIGNMTMARHAMATREKLNERKAMAMRAQEQQFQVQTAEQAAQLKLQADMQALQAKAQADQELVILQGKIQQALDNNKAMLEAEMNGVTNMVQERIKKQEGIDSIVKEAMRSKAENYKTDMQHQAKVHASNVQSATQITNAQISAKAKKDKPKSKAA